MQHIIVYNHSTSLLFLFRSVLMELGYNVTTFVDTMPEVAVLEEQHPDLIILGNLMGIADEEFDIIRNLRQAAPLSDCPVIVCTTSPQPYHTFLRRENLRQVYVLEKPFSFSALRAAVTMALGA